MLFRTYVWFWQLSLSAAARLTHKSCRQFRWIVAWLLQALFSPSKEPNSFGPTSDPPASRWTLGHFGPTETVNAELLCYPKSCGPSMPSITWQADFIVLCAFLHRDLRLADGVNVT